MASRSIAPELLEPWVKKIFFKRFAERAQQYTELFNVETSSRAFEDTFAVAGLGTFTVKPEGVPVSYDDPVQGDRKRTIMLTFALAFRVTMEMMEDDQHGIIAKMPKDLAASGEYSMETLAAGLVNDSFAGSDYKGLPEGDGTRRALCSTGHVFLRDTGSTWSNALSPAVALSISGIEAAITIARKQKGEEGRYVNMRVSKLVIPPDLEWTARKLIDTDREPFSADNTSNEIGKEGLSIMSWNHLSSTTRWFLASEKSGHTLTFYKRKGMTFGEATDSDTYDRKYMAHWRGNVTFDDPRGIIGSNA
jgi:phage major head subunit gpT-like protein